MTRKFTDDRSAVTVSSTSMYWTVLLVDSVVLVSVMGCLGHRLTFL